MNYYLVDLENVCEQGLMGADLLEADDMIVVFYSRVTSTVHESDRERVVKDGAAVEIRPVWENIMTDTEKDKITSAVKPLYVRECEDSITLYFPGARPYRENWLAEISVTILRQEDGKYWIITVITAINMRSYQRKSRGER